mgnify:CR=1 FL=1
MIELITLQTIRTPTDVALEDLFLTQVVFVVNMNVVAGFRVFKSGSSLLNVQDQTVDHF